jgi:hypothetical protein
VTKDPRVYLAHILERANRIEEYVRDGQASFMSDPKTQDAVIRNFEVIGEAAKRVPPGFRDVLFMATKASTSAASGSLQRATCRRSGAPSPPSFRRLSNLSEN